MATPDLLKIKITRSSKVKVTICTIFHLETSNGYYANITSYTTADKFGERVEVILTNNETGQQQFFTRRGLQVDKTTVANFLTTLW